MNEPKRQQLLPRGRIIKRVVLADLDVEYLLYVPHTATRHSPIFVAVHGLSANVEEQIKLLTPHCENSGFIMVVPRFRKDVFSDYQRLGRQGRGKRADLGLNNCLRDVSLITGADASQFYLYGFSGGAQFAHRYVLAHPHRVSCAVVVGAGWYTFPDPCIRYPHGIRQNRKLPGVYFNPEEFLRVPIVVLVGQNDISANLLRKSPRLDEEQGLNRLERGRNWVASMQVSAKAHNMPSLVSFIEVPNTDHSFAQFRAQGRLAERVFLALGQHQEKQMEDSGVNTDYRQFEPRVSQGHER